MLFSTEPTAGSSGPTSSSAYPAYTHHLAHSSGLPHPVAPQHPLKSFQQAALVSSMLQASNPSAQSELITSLNYHHVESVASAAPAVRVPSGAEAKSASPGSQRPQNASPNSTTSRHNQNEVSTVMLCGVPIVSLVMDGQERLCLAQISNTLLKGFSYNEIHNRRVALGITCVQCTPVQLELLRRAGAMPVSSRRCGMITKREAEPPKLPDTFAFDVFHACAWGCRGSFTPSRYNSSRAKCIKCVYCGLFFSPNKFIFHSHRLPTSKYVQPDAANFNSWRRHIRLVTSPEPPEHVSYAWEDVKAMFNGGSRKRAMSTTLNSFTKNQENHSKALAKDKHALNKYKYSDENSGLDDSDEYCSMDASPAKKPNIASNDSCEGNTSSNPIEIDEASPAITHPYQFAPKGIFESHFKKAFEVSSLVGSSHSKPNESSKDAVPRTQASPSKLTSSEQVPPKGGELMSSFSFSPIESYLESAKNGPMSKPISAPQALVPPHAPYLGHPSSEQALVAGYSGLFGGQHHFGRQYQMSDPRMASSTHPAILSTLLNGMPESAASHHLRSGLLPSNFVQMPSLVPPPNGASSDLTSPSLLNPTSNAPGSQAELRHNLAEFMWSMASKAPSQYNFLWPTANHPAASVHPAMGGQMPSHSSSSSSTPTLSPNQTQHGTAHDPTMGHGNLFGFKSANADDIRKALLLNSNLLHQQRSAATNPSMSFLPNIMNPNLRLIPSNANANLTGAGPLGPSYMLTKENAENEPNSSNKSPELLPSHQASPLATVPSPLFPFRSAFTATAPLDRFSNEMLAARNQFLIDAYHSNSIPSNRSIFHPSLFMDKQRFEEHNNDTDAESHKSIDVIGDDSESHHSMTIKTMYPFTYAKNSGKAANGMPKYGRKNMKRTSHNDHKLGVSLKAKNAKRKVNDELLVMEEDSQHLDMNQVVVNEGASDRARDSGDEANAEGKHPFEKRYLRLGEASADSEQRSLAADSPTTNCDSKRNSPIEYMSSQSPNQNNYGPFICGQQSPTQSSSNNATKKFMLPNGTESCAGQNSPGNQAIKLVT